MIRFICLGLWLTLFQADASAEWVELYQNSDGALFIDHSLIKNLSNGKISSWVKIGATPNSANTETWEAAGFGPYPYSLSRFVTDCSTWQNAITSVRYYSTNGEKLISEKHHSPWIFKDIVPDTLGDALAEAVCKVYMKK